MVTEKEILEMELLYMFENYKKMRKTFPIFLYKDKFLNLLKQTAVSMREFAKQFSCTKDYEYNLIRLKSLQKEYNQLEKKFFKNRNDKYLMEEYMKDIQNLTNYINQNKIEFERSKRYIDRNEYVAAPIDPNFIPDYHYEFNENFKLPLLNEGLSIVLNKYKQASEENKLFIDFIKSIIELHSDDLYYFSGRKIEKIFHQINEQQSKFINNLQIIPSYYSTEEAITNMLFYYVNKRGDTIKELINLYEQEKWQNKMLQATNYITSTINFLNDNIGRRFVSLGYELNCIKTTMNNGYKFVSEKINELEDSQERHYMILAEQLSELKSDNIEYHSKIYNSLKNLEDKKIDLSIKFEEKNYF